MASFRHFLSFHTHFVAKLSFKRHKIPYNLIPIIQVHWIGFVSSFFVILHLLCSEIDLSHIYNYPSILVGGNQHRFYREFAFRFHQYSGAGEGACRPQALKNSQERGAPDLRDANGQKRTSAAHKQKVLPMSWVYSVTYVVILTVTGCTTGDIVYTLNRAHG